MISVTLTFAQENKQAKILLDTRQAKYKINKEIYGHFAEHLGNCIYGGFYVGENSSIPNTRGIRNDVIKALKEMQIPVLRWSGGCFADTYNWKDGIDDAKSAYNAVSYLIKKGYKRIAHFAGPIGLEICKKRLNGYKEALKNAKLHFEEGLIQYGGLHEQDGYNSMEFLLKKKLIPDAIFAVNDPVAIGAFQRIKESHLKIPKDIAIIGFSNNKITSLVDPPLTTVNQPSFEMGKKAAEILIGQIENKNKSLEPKTIVLKAELIIRGSTR